MANKQSSAEIRECGSISDTCTLPVSPFHLQAGRPHTHAHTHTHTHTHRAAAQLVRFKRFVDWRDIPSAPSLPIWPEAVCVLS